MNKEITITEFLEDVKPEFDAFKLKLEKYKETFKMIHNEEFGYILEIDLSNLELK